MTVAKFDWDDHNGEHVLDQPEARVLFVFPDEHKAHSAYNKALAALDPAERFSPGERIWFKSGSELAFHSLVSEENKILQGKYHRIVIEDLQTVIPDTAGSSIAVRAIAERLITDTDIKPKLYLTYTAAPEVFVLTPDENGVIDPEILELANG